MGEPEHGGHIFFVAEIVAGHPQQEPGFSAGIIQAHQDQTAVIVVAVEQKAVVAVGPVLPGQKADVLGTDL